MVERSDIIDTGKTDNGPMTGLQGMTLRRIYVRVRTMIQSKTIFLQSYNVVLPFTHPLKL